VLLEQLAGPLNKQQQEYVEDVLGAGKHLLSLINDILDLAKVEAGKMGLELSEFSLREALQSGLTLIKERAAGSAIELSVKVEPGLDLIKADERKVKQVVFNLLSNAVKFTPGGGAIHVAARRNSELDFVEVSVTDTGIGIAPEDQTTVFGEFEQVGASRHRKHEGTGLGLSLVKQLVELQGGRVWLNSQVGKGSTFGFTIPVVGVAAVDLEPVGAAMAEPGLSGNGHAPLSNGDTVLVVDDDSGTRALLRVNLESAGFQVELAGDGQQGLLKARALRPAVIVLDVILPKLDGWDFLAQIKADPVLAAIPVLVVSAVDERGRGFALGAADYIVKPVGRDELLAAVRRALPSTPGSMTLLARMRGEKWPTS
jgi:CheY-like chemotaxis protein